MVGGCVGAVSRAVTTLNFDLVISSLVVALCS